MWNAEIKQKYPHLFGQRCSIGVGAGWKDIILGVIEKAAAQSEPVLFLQIKEKFGSLRIYCTSNQAFEKIVADAEKQSNITCEICGKPGSQKTFNGWVKTVCPEHEKR